MSTVAGGGVSPLRAVLAEVRAAGPGRGLDEIAKSLGLARDEVDAMVEYWERRGKLTIERLRGCPSGGCSAKGAGGCAVDGGAANGAAGCPVGAGGDGGPVLIAISPRRNG
jgi:hypothetical protein